MTRPLRRRTAAVTSRVLVALALGACESSSTGSSPGGSAAETGRQIFASSKCRACHTLAAAGSNGNVGPNLNSVKPSSTAVVSQVTNGGGGMLSFKGQLATAQIAAEAHSVTSVT